jgi:hypothetical protein
MPPHFVEGRFAGNGPADLSAQAIRAKAEGAVHHRELGRATYLLPEISEQGQCNGSRGIVCRKSIARAADYAVGYPAGMPVAFNRPLGQADGLTVSAVIGVEKRGQKIALDAPIILGRADAVMVGILALTAIYFFVYPAWRAQFFIEIWFTEGWNAYFQDAAAAGSRLYPEPGSLTVNNYPPLSFYAIGLLGKIFGDNLFVGRSISLIALILVSCEIFCCVRTLVGGLVGPAIGAFWYAAIMSHNFTAYVGANDPQLAGEAIMGGGLALLLARERSGRSVLLPLLIMVVGAFWKHNMIAIPITAVLWLFMQQGRRAWRPVSISVLVAVAGLGICAAIFGAGFFANLMFARHYGFDGVLRNIGHLQWSAPAMVLWLIWALFARTAAARFTIVHVAVAFTVCLLQWFGDKVFGNAEFDLMIALGIAIGVSVETINRSPVSRYLGVTRSRGAVVSLLMLRFVATDRHEPLLVMFDPAFREQFAAGERSALREVKQVAAIEGPVFCFSKVVCRAAGKPFTVDDFKVEEMIATNAISGQHLDQWLRTLQVTTFTNAPATMGTVDTSLSHAIARRVSPRSRP